MTKVLRYDLTADGDLAASLEAACEVQLQLGYKLVSTFVWETTLVLIFQK